MGMPFSQNTSQQQGSADSQMLSQMQGLPPAVQKALLLHLQQQQGSEPQGFEEQGGKTPKGECEGLFIYSKVKQSCTHHQTLPFNN